MGRRSSAPPIGVGGARFLDEASAGVAATLAVSVTNAWVLLVEINR